MLAGTQTLKEGLRTYLKSQGYKSKTPKGAYELTEIQKKELSDMRSTLIMDWLKLFLLIILSLNERIGNEKVD